MAYQRGSEVVPIQPGETACYRHGDEFILLDPNSFAKYHNHPDYTPCIRSNECVYLPVGTNFMQISSSPPVKLLGYYAPLLPGEQAVVYIEGVWHDVYSETALAWTQYPGVYVGVKREGRVDVLPLGSWFQVEAPLSAPPVENPPQVIVPTEVPSSHINSAESPAASQPAPAPAEPCETPASKSLPRYAEEIKQSALTSQSMSRPRPSSTCKSCKTETQEVLPVFSQFFCLRCLLEQFQKQRLSSPSRSGKCDWNAELIYALWTELKEKLSPEDLPKLPQQCPLPLDSTICLGKNVPIKPNYPPTGHIVGSSSICSEDSCPEHLLCRACADSLSECPQCGHTISFEEPQDCGCESAESILQPATFDTPCSNCGKKLERRKGPRPPSTATEI